MQTDREGDCRKQMIMNDVCLTGGGGAEQGIAPHSIFTLLCFIPLPPSVCQSSVIALTWPDSFHQYQGIFALCCILSLHIAALCVLRLWCSASPMDAVDPSFKVK